MSDCDCAWVSVATKYPAPGVNVLTYGICGFHVCHLGPAKNNRGESTGQTVWRASQRVFEAAAITHWKILRKPESTT